MTDGHQIPPKGPDQPDAGAKLSMTEIYTLAYVASIVRGYPEPIPDEIAWRVLWLEQRGLPGLVALTREFLNNHDTDFRERGMQCPIIAGAMLGDHFDELVSKDPDRPNVIEGPANGVLILAKVADYARQTGEPVRVSWIMGEPPQIAGQCVVDAEKVATFGDVNALILNTGVGFARHDEPLKEGSGPQASEAEIPRQVFEPLLGYIGKQRLQTALKVNGIFKSDPQALELLRAMSAGDRSILASSPQLEDDKAIVLTTSKGSSNDQLWQRFTAYNWTAPHDDELPEELAKITSQYLLTDDGREVMPMLLHALDRFPPTKH
ncbi:MAG: DUF3726 domain-containing protein [Alphaproteobacteria bacterium]|nr:DUF3726 domain-containing protein [Alphaproteobacteria bacterium]